MKKIGRIFLLMALMLSTALGGVSAQEASIALTAAAGKNGIILAWDAAANADSYKIFKDGTELAQTAETGYTDEKVEPETAYSYKIEALSANEAVGESNEAWAFFDDASKVEAVSVYKNQARNDNVVYIEHQKWGSIGYSDENTIIGGTAAKWSMRTDGENNQIYFKTQHLNEEGNVVYRPYDISGIKETGYLSMLIYPKTELADFLNDIKVVLYSGPQNATAKQSNIVSIKNQLEMNKWNVVKVPLATFANGQIEFANTSRILIQSYGAYEANSMTYYIQNVRFCDEAGVSISSAAYENGSVNINLETKNITASKYVIKCNGEVVTETAEKSYSYTPSEKGQILEYTVEATDDNSGITYTSTAKSVYVEDPSKITVASVYKNSKPDTLTILTLSNYDYPTYTDENTIIGGKAIKWSMRAEAGNQLKMEMNPTIDASAAEESGYLSMLVYPKTELETLPGNISVFYYGNGKDTNVVSISDQLTMNKWNLVKVPVATLINDRGTTLDSSKINQVWIRAAGEYEANALILYVQNIEFCTESNVEITKATYANGKVTLNWQSNITPASYVVKCDGEVIGTYKGTAKFALITPKKYGTVAVYTVEALDADGEVIAESAERMLFIENKNDISANKVTIFGNSKESDTTISVLPNYGGYKAYTGTSPLGGEAMTLNVFSKATIDNRGWSGVNGLKIETTGKDVSNNKIGGYLRMLVYPQTKLEAFPGKVNTAIYSKNAAGKVEQSNVIYIDGMLEMNKWNTVTIPMASLLNGSNVDISNITQIAFNATGDYENDGDCIFYVQGIEFGITEDVHANEITAEKSGNTVTFSAEVNNLTGSAASPAIIAAAYTADGKLESVEIFNKDSVESKNTGVVSGTFELPENTTYKAMLVNDTTAMKPITKVLAEAAE